MCGSAVIVHDGSRLPERVKPHGAINVNTKSRWPMLIVRIKKKTDGAAALSCTRADGSITWQRQDGQVARFFPLHDLTHFAVESTLGFRQAFYGLIESGWDISTFAEPG